MTGPHHQQTPVLRDLPWVEKAKYAAIPFTPPARLSNDFVLYGKELFASLKPTFIQKGFDRKQAFDFYKRLVDERVDDLHKFLVIQAEDIHRDGGILVPKSLNVHQGLLTVELAGSCVGCGATKVTIGNRMNKNLSDTKSGTEKAQDLGLDGKPRLSWMTAITGQAAKPKSREELQQSISRGKNGFSALPAAELERLQLELPPLAPPMGR